MSVQRLEAWAQISTARTFWKTTPTFLRSRGHKYYNQLEKMEKSAERNMQRLPRKIKHLITQGIKNVQIIDLQFCYWLNTLTYRQMFKNAHYLLCEKLWDPKSSYYIHNFLTDEFKFDDNKLVRKLVNDKQWDATIRFTFACIYCLVDHIEENWQKFSVHQFSWGVRQYYMVEFWINFMKNPSVNPSKIRDAFRVCTSWCNSPSVMYFWDQLTDEQKLFYTDDVENMIRLVGRSGVNYTVIPYLLKLMPFEQQVVIMSHIVHPSLVIALINPHCDIEFYKNIFVKLDNRTMFYFDMLHFLSGSEVYNHYLTVHFWYFELVQFLWKGMREDEGLIALDDKIAEVFYNFWRYKRWDCFRLIVEDLTCQSKWTILERYSQYVISRFDVTESKGFEKSLIIFLQIFGSDDKKICFRDDAVSWVDRLWDLNRQLRTLVPLWIRLIRNIEECRGTQ